jgi:raffinose/stachyose/melibiose transport system substrate-binding protein
MKKTIVVVLAVFGIVCLAGCAKKGEAAGGTKTITWMTIRANTPVWDSIISQYEQENPGVKVELERISDGGAYIQKLQILAASKALPDMFDAEKNFLAEIAPTGILMDIDELYRELGYDRILDIGLNYARQDNGRLYSICWENNIEYIWYRKDLFAKAGIVRTPETFDEFLEVCQRLKAAGIAPISVSGINGWPLIRYISFIPFRLTGNDFIDNLKTGNGRMSDPVGIQAAEFFQRLAGNYFQPGWATCDYTNALQIFLSSNAAMYNIGTWQFGSFIGSDRELEGDFDFFYMPTLRGAVNGKTDMVAHAGTGTAIRRDRFADQQLRHFVRYMLEKYPEAAFYQGNTFPAMSFDTTLGTLSNFDRHVMNDNESITSFLKPWDVELDAATNEVLGKEIVNLGMGVITAQEFAGRIDDTIARNVSR